MIVLIPKDAPYAFIKDENDNIIIPDISVELQSFTGTLWDEIHNENNYNYDKIELYNEAAQKYNKQIKFQAITIINNFKNQKMATTKKAVKKSAPKKATKKIVTKSAPAKKSVPVKPVETKEKKVSQKSQIVELAAKGKTIDEIAEITGIKKTNVSWYFYKLKLGKLNEYTN